MSESVQSKTEPSQLCKHSKKSKLNHRLLKQISSIMKQNCFVSNQSCFISFETEQFCFMLYNACSKFFYYLSWFFRVYILLGLYRTFAVFVNIWRSSFATSCTWPQIRLFVTTLYVLILSRFVDLKYAQQSRPTAAHSQSHPTTASVNMSLSTGKADPNTRWSTLNTQH